MAPRPSPWVQPLDRPLAIAAAGLLLVALTRLTPLGLLPSLLIAVPAAVGLSQLRARPRSRAERRREQRVDASIEAALQRLAQLALQAELLGGEALSRWQEPDQLEPLALVQLCCERLRELPQRIRQRRALLESGGGILLPLENLQARLQREREQLRRESSPSLRRERQRLVDQLARNVEAAGFGLDAREVRLLALSTGLERIDGGLRQLQLQLDAPWTSSEAGAAAVAAAIEPLQEALDQIDRLLDAGPDPDP
jgi:hypothetical protein